MSEALSGRPSPSAEQVRRAERLLDRVIQDVDGYHAHKEKMAHAALLIMLAVVGAMFGTRWPPDWAPTAAVSMHAIIILLSVLLAWLAFQAFCRLARSKESHLISVGSIFAVALGAISGVLLWTYWPGHWLLAYPIPRRETALLGYFLVWSLLHVYMRFQLRHRREAAVTYAGAIRALVEWACREPTIDDLRRYRFSSDIEMSTGLASGLRAWIDHWLFPCPAFTRGIDVSHHDYPNWLCVSIREQIAKGTGALTGEWIITLGSFLALVLGSVKTLFG